MRTLSVEWLPFIHHINSKAKSCALILSYRESHEKQKQKQLKRDQFRSTQFNRPIETRVQERNR